MDSGRKIFLLLHLAYVMFIIGSLMSMLGTTIPDLQCVFTRSLETLSRFFLVVGVPLIISCVFSVYVLKKWNLHLVMTICMCVYTCTIPSIAISPFIEVAFTALALAGLALGVGATGAFYMCHQLYPDSDYAFHTISSMMSFGSFISPIFADRFLGKKVQIESYSNASASPSLCLYRYKDTEHSLILDTLLNRSHGMSILLNVSSSDNSSADTTDLFLRCNYSTHVIPYCENLQTHVVYLYVILGLLAGPLAVSFFVLFIKSRKNSDFMIAKPTDTYSNVGITSRVDMIFIVLMGISLPPAYGIAFLYGSYLTTFGEEVSLDSGVHKMAYLTSVFWLCFLLGRISAAAATYCLKQVTILYFCYIGQIVSIVVVIVTGETDFNEIFLWVGSVFLGLSSAPIFGASVLFGRSYVSLTPFVLGVWNMADYAGVTFLPYISGQLIYKHGFSVHLYFCLGLTLFQLVLFIVLHCIGRRIGNVNDESAMLVNSMKTETSSK